jgi:prepilin-type N-terminal cleavage/methylation domain-containing protein
MHTIFEFGPIQAPRRKPGDLPPVNPSLRDGLPAAHSAPRGFTLTELLVVIGIMAVLAALVTPAVLRARSSARNAAIKAEIDMLHMAIMNYKNEYGSFPPCNDIGIPNVNGPAGKHLRRLFPRCPDVATQFAAVGNVVINPSNAIVVWLSGYTSDPTNPWAPPAARKRLYDFDQSRVLNNAYFPSGRPNSAYMYIDNTYYFNPTTNLIPTYSVAGVGIYFAHRVPLPIAPALFNNTLQPAFNPDSFQILSAGADQIFGNDDDMSNFWKGTRAEYIESVK